MSEWRRKAIDLFPQRRAAIEKAESVGLLWVDLSLDFFGIYHQSSSDEASFVFAVYRYLQWCMQSRDTDTYNAACIGFAEELASFAVRQDEATYRQITRDIASHFDHLEIRKLAPCLAIPLGPGRIDKFLADIAQAQHEHEKSLKRVGRQQKT